MENTQVVHIEIDDITSGKVNIFSFYRQGKQIDHRFLKLRDKSISSQYNYNHHLDRDDLQKLSNRFSTIYPYDKKTRTINEWANAMIKEMFELIKNGKWDRKVKEDRKIYDVRYVWIGDKPTRLR
jgi:hypothetical protein